MYTLVIIFSLIYTAILTGISFLIGVVFTDVPISEAFQRAKWNFIPIVTAILVMAMMYYTDIYMRLC